MYADTGSVSSKARIFLLVDLQDFFFRFRVGGTRKINKKALKMTSYWSFSVLFFFFFFFFFFFSFSELFFFIFFINISRKTVKLVW